MKAWIRSIRPLAKRHRLVACACPVMMLAVSSCVPTDGYNAPFGAAAAAFAATLPAPPAEVIDQSGAQAITGETALAANAALPAFEGLIPAASSFIVRGRTPLDGLRSLDCLSQAIYYEAANESEEGQRGVAQVVLNRVRHPAWPNTVCGVVYQGPMRPGGGCQFTFTCDGSLMRRAGGSKWLRARQLASEALAGGTFAPVGLSTHYHANYVFPSWAPKLAKTTQIGAHIFYALPGQWGQRRAFSDVYRGGEPLPRPAMTMPRPGLVPAFASSLPGGSFVPDAAATAAPPQPVRRAEAPRIEAEAVDTLLPQTQVREEYRNSGQWRTDSPVAPPAAPAAPAAAR
ncbi:MAG TPA: cell wall hydrolase [Allosphingosinicella sp.]|nr:cell wall hydrolase [Allosphingosinicella sp.]